MLCLNGSSPWSGFTIAIVFCVLLAHNVESFMPDVHMGILETSQDIQKEEKSNTGQDIQKEKTSNTVKLLMRDEVECKRYQRFQCSYALSALRHLQFTKRFLYNSNGELMSVSDFKDMSFDTEAVLMLATLDCGPYRDALYNSLWALWFYAVRLRGLLDALSEPTVTEKPKDNYMFEVHQSLEKSLRSFVDLYKSKLRDVEKKYNEINGQEQTCGERKLFERNWIVGNKKLLNEQIAENKKRRVWTKSTQCVSFEKITTLHKLEGIGRIVVEYLGEKYWNAVRERLRKMYATATRLDVTLGLQIVFLWHTRNGILKILKLILLQFLENYLDFVSSTNKASEEIGELDKTMFTMLKGFNETLGIEDKKNSVVQMFGKRLGDDGSKFDEMIKKQMITEIQHYPKFADVNDIPHGDISDYYKLLTECFTGERKTEISDERQPLANMESYLGKVQRLFLICNLNISKSFDNFVFSEPYQSMANVQCSVHD